MAKLSLAVVASLAASASAFAPSSAIKASTALQASTGIWDPMGLYELGSGEAFDTFPNVFPDKQYLQASEVKHGRQAMLAWTGVWATTEVRSLSWTKRLYLQQRSSVRQHPFPAHVDLFPFLFQGGFGLGLHFPGFPAEADWTKALGVFATEQPVWFGSILALICIAEGESVGHSGDNFRGKSTKADQGNLNFDYLGLKQRVSSDKYARYQEVELKVNSMSLVSCKCSDFTHEYKYVSFLQNRMVAPL